MLWSRVIQLNKKMSELKTAILESFRIFYIFNDFRRCSGCSNLCPSTPSSSPSLSWSPSTGIQRSSSIVLRFAFFRRILWFTFCRRILWCPLFRLWTKQRRLLNWNLSFYLIIISAKKLRILKNSISRSVRCITHRIIKFLIPHFTDDFSLHIRVRQMFRVHWLQLIFKQQ